MRTADDRITICIRYILVVNRLMGMNKKAEAKTQCVTMTLGFKSAYLDTQIH